MSESSDSDLPAINAATALTVNESEARICFPQQQLDRAQMRHAGAIKSLAKACELLPTAL